MNIDLLLVNPGNRLEQFSILNELATVAQPLGIALIASYARQNGFSVAIIDAEAEFWTPEQTIHEIEKYNPLLIGLSAFTTKMTAAGEILKLIKERMPNVKTVLGGHHASAIPERTLREETVDFVVKGEGFIPTVELLKRIKAKSTDYKIQGVWYLKEGMVIAGGRSNGIELNELPSAAWDLLPMKKYRAHHWQTWGGNLDLSGFAVLYTSLGCPLDCDYCSVNVVYGRHMTRYRKVSNAVREMELLVSKYKVKTLELVDANFTLNPARAEKLRDEIIYRHLNLNLWCFARTDRVNPYLMEKMKRAGINWVFMGFESGQDFVLKSIHKKQTVGLIKRATEIVRNAGINVGGNYVFGLPGDTQETMQQTLDLAKELNTEYANFFITMAYPGTRLFDRAEAEGLPLPDRWGQYGFFAPDALPLRTETLSSQEILRFRDNAFKEYFNSERYQNMIRDKFGQGTLDFLRTKILSKDIVRI